MKLSKQGVTTYDIQCTTDGYPVDIDRLSSCWIQSKQDYFQRFFKFLTLHTDIWLIYRYTQQIFFDILLKSVRYSIESRSILS